MNLRTALLAVCLLLAPAPCALADEYRAQVIGVADGDTITVLHDGTPERIRLAGVDCPEKKQAFGQRAKEFTASMVFGKEVDVQSHGHDRYGRTIADIEVPGTGSLNQALLRTGLAWWYRKYSKDVMLGELEEQARASRSGLWQGASPLPPWDFRHHRQMVAGRDALHDSLSRF